MYLQIPRNAGARPLTLNPFLSVNIYGNPKDSTREEVVCLAAVPWEKGFRLPWASQTAFRVGESILCLFEGRSTAAVLYGRTHFFCGAVLALIFTIARRVRPPSLSLVDVLVFLFLFSSFVRWRNNRSQSHEQQTSGRPRLRPQWFSCQVTPCKTPTPQVVRSDRIPIKLLKIVIARTLLYAPGK